MKIKEMEREICDLTGALISKGLCDAQNYPAVVESPDSFSIVYDGFGDISTALRNIDYNQIHKYLDDKKQYNFKLIDGALVQLLYIYDRKGSLLKHRLCYFPSPSFECFQNDPELYLSEGDLYADVIAKNILPVPIRFDFDPSNHQNIYHPSSHITFGQFKNCRIPVVSPLCPVTFMDFILSSFYNTAYINCNLQRKKFRFQDTITEQERTLLHIALT